MARRNCIEFPFSDLTTLKAARLVNKGLNELASESLFHTVSFTNTENSPVKFAKTVSSSSRKHIRHVVINTSDDPDREITQQDASEAEILGVFRDAIALFPQLERLERAELKFSSSCIANYDNDDEVPESEDFRAEIQDLCFQALVKCEKIKSLTIKNLQDAMSEEVLESESFLIVRGRLTEMHLRIVSQTTECAPDRDIDEEALHQGFTCGLPRYWLKPATNQLIRLTLDCDVYWGLWPLTDFREIPPFPHLKSMCFGNWTIAHDWQVDWIVAHEITLEVLLLYDCTVVRDLRMDREQAEANFPQMVQPEPTVDYGSQGTATYPEYSVEVDLRWHQIFERFRVGLERLRHYDLKRDFSVAAYYSFDYGISSPWDPYIPEVGEDGRNMQDPDCDEKNERAFVALAETVQQRASTKTE